MARRWNECRDSLIVVLLKVSVLLGVSNHLYDPASQQLIYSSGAFVYRICLHSASFIVIVTSFKGLLAYVLYRIREKTFLSELSVACVYVNMTITLSVLVSDWMSRGRGTRPLNELLEVRIDYSISSEELACVRRHAWKLFFLKSMLVVAIVSSSFLFISTQYSAEFAMIASSLSLNFIQVALVAFRQQFSMAMIYGGYLFKALNLRLSRVVEEINNSLHLSRSKSQRLKEELARIGHLHTSLMDLLTRIKDIDQIHMLVMLATTFFCQVCAMFYLLLAVRGLMGEKSIPMFFFQTGNTFLSTIDLLVSLHICGECVRACDASGSILKGLKTFVVLDRVLERDIDLLSFQFAREKMHLTIWGMFDLDANTGPGMLKGIMMNIILLTQVAYDELH